MHSIVLASSRAANYPHLKTNQSISEQHDLNLLQVYSFTGAGHLLSSLYVLLKVVLRSSFLCCFDFGGITSAAHLATLNHSEISITILSAYPRKLICISRAFYEKFLYQHFLVYYASTEPYSPLPSTPLTDIFGFYFLFLFFFCTRKSDQPFPL